ncbi:MAG: hypothetical protein Q7S54_01490 [bacterium]|nr:hypothetical protein [bacterium]
MVGVGFLFGLMIGVIVSAGGIVSLVSAYPRLEQGDATEFYTSIAYLLMGMAVLAVVAGVAGLMRHAGVAKHRDFGVNRD